MQQSNKLVSNGRELEQDASTEIAKLRSMAEIENEKLENLKASVEEMVKKREEEERILRELNREIENKEEVLGNLERYLCRFKNFPPVLMNGDELDTSASFTQLGLSLSSNLTWKTHIHSLAKHASQKFDFLARAHGFSHLLTLYLYTSPKSVLL